MSIHALITGGAGYIGSHLTHKMLSLGYSVVVVDNFKNTNAQNINILKNKYPDTLYVHEISLQDEDTLDMIFRMYPIYYVFHLASFKSVKEAEQDPLLYYDNNLQSTISLLKVMVRNKVWNLIFSSSATVYGTPKSLPIDEEHSVSPANVYGRTKYFIEEILKDTHSAYPNFKITILRYFNPVGFDKLKETPKDIPENLFPYITKVLEKKYDYLNIYGTDYDTKDGSCIRDYIHISDLISAHVSCLKTFSQSFEFGTNIKIYNVGTGQGYSVIEIVKCIENIQGEMFPHIYSERRPGDVPVCYADASKIKRELGWEPVYNIHDMCSSIIPKR